MIRRLLHAITRKRAVEVPAAEPQWLLWDDDDEAGMTPEDAAMLRQGFVRLDNRAATPTPSLPLEPHFGMAPCPAWAATRDEIDQETSNKRRWDL